MTDDSLYERIATQVSGVTPLDLERNVLLTNSEWTADAVEDTYGIRPRVLYPPIDAVTTVLDEPRLQHELRMTPAEIRRHFGRDRFQRQFSSIVDELLESTATESVTRPLV